MLENKRNLFISLQLTECLVLHSQWEAEREMICVHTLGALRFQTRLLETWRMVTKFSIANNSAVSEPGDDCFYTKEKERFLPAAGKSTEITQYTEG